MGKEANDSSISFFNPIYAHRLFSIGENSLFQRRLSQGIVGEIANSGTHNWQSLSVEAEFYDKDGKFLDEYQSYMQGSIAAGTNEHFKILVTGNSSEMKKPDVNVKVKISSAHNYDN